MLTLRPYQQRGVDEIRERFSKGDRAVLYVLPTGGGKTVIFSHIAQQSSLRGKNVLILVHRVELLRQTSSALTKSGVNHGLINPKYTPDLSASVQVASVQTLIKRLDKIQPPDLIIIDECHHATAGSWRKVINHFPNCRILGVTATPIRTDGTGLNIIFDSMVLGPPVSELIELGYLVKAVIYAPPVQLDFSDIKIIRGEYDQQKVTEIVDQPTITGSAVDHYRKLCPGVPAVAFCVSVEHAEHVARDFRQAGFKAYSVDGTMEDDMRFKILNGLGDGTIEVVTSCDLISEGTDIPAITCAILLRPTNSLGLSIQQPGRAIRPAPGKKEAIILDHVGNTIRHGFPDDVREWSLEGRKKNRRNSPLEMDIRVQQCEVCFACHPPAPICPYCGNENEVKYKSPKEIEGELVEIQRAEEVSAKQERKEKRMEVGKAVTLAELMKIQQERNYKPGWARKQLSIKQAKLI